MELARDLGAAWKSDYRSNINYQMDYCPSQSANLSELHLLATIGNGNELPVKLSPRAVEDGWRGMVKSEP